jgi:hypothetical protein
LNNLSVRQVDGVGIFYKKRFIEKIAVSEVSRNAKFHDALPMEIQD